MIRYPSLSAMLDRITPEGMQAASEDSVDWAGGLTVEQAIEAARFGWKDGVVQAGKLAERIASRTLAGSSHNVVPVIGYDVCGGAFDPGAVNMGVPECWGTIDQLPAKRAIWLAVNVAASCGVDASDLLKRGIAIGALVMALQAEGYPLTVDVLQLAEPYSGAKDISLAVRVLDATGSQLDLDRLVFTVGHPSFFRQLCRSASDSELGVGAWGSQVPCDNLPNGFGKPDLYIGGAHLEQAERWQDGGEDWVLKEFERQTQS